jgi:hypothetical protein
LEGSGVVFVHPAFAALLGFVLWVREGTVRQPRDLGAISTGMLEGLYRAALENVDKALS